MDEPPPGVNTTIAELDLQGPLGRALGLPPGKVMLLHGGPGTGKSTLAMLALPNAPVVSNEQDPELVASYRTRLGLPWVPRAQLVTDDEDEAVDVEIRASETEPIGLIVDSLSMAAGDPVRLVAFFIAWAEATDQPVIVIAHETKDDTMAGPQKLGHAVHAVVQLQEVALGRTIYVDKRRSGPSGHIVPFRLQDDKSEPRYFSIEGHGKRLRLAEHPTSGAEYAAPLALWEKDELVLPKPPLAVAAKRSRLGPGGLLVPGDIAARRAFAAGFGLELWEPGK